ncbi:hypothetical protein pb186bvf_015615 [Paramecium bursaria]
MSQTPKNQKTQQDYSISHLKNDSIEYLKTVVPNQYVTYEIFDFAFKKLWAIINKLEIQQLECCANTKLIELEKRIENIEELLHKLNNINYQEQQYKSTEMNYSSISNNIQGQFNQIIEVLNQQEGKFKQQQDAIPILTRVVADMQQEFDQIREQVDKLDQDLLGLFKSFQTVLTIEKTVNINTCEMQDIRESIKEIYQYI